MGRKSKGDKKPKKGEVASSEPPPEGALPSSGDADKASSKVGIASCEHAGDLELDVGKHKKSKWTQRHAVLFGGTDPCIQYYKNAKGASAGKQPEQTLSLAEEFPYAPTT